MQTMKVNAPKLQTSVLAYEVHPDFTREQATLLAGDATERVAEIGLVVGKISASGKIVQHAPGASDGSQNAYGIVIAKAVAPYGEDAQVLLLERGPALVKAPGLIWADGISDGNKATAVAALLAKGIRIVND
jgi:hypothetical protein